MEQKRLEQLNAIYEMKGAARAYLEMATTSKEASMLARRKDKKASLLLEEVANAASARSRKLAEEFQNALAEWEKGGGNGG